MDPIYKYYYKRAINCPPGKHHLNDILLLADDGPTLNTGLVAL